jgi:hypothetical protein
VNTNTSGVSYGSAIILQLLGDGVYDYDGTTGTAHLLINFWVMVHYPTVMALMFGLYQAVPPLMHSLWEVAEVVAVRIMAVLVAAAAVVPLKLFHLTALQRARITPSLSVMVVQL